MYSSENYRSSTETGDDVYVNTQDCQIQSGLHCRDQVNSVMRSTGLEMKNKGRRTEGDDYVNIQNRHPKQKTHAGMSKDSKRKGMMISAFFLLLLLGALSALGAVGVLYRHKVISYEKLSEQYANVTKALMMHGQNMEETERLYETLKVNHQQVQKDLSVCNANLKNYKPCEEGWKSLGLKCYYFSTEKLNWTQSRDYCVEKGGHLVVITSRTEQYVVSSLIGVTHWIGLNDLETEGKWMWVNNQLLTETGVTFWCCTEPDNWKVEDPAGENCGAMGAESSYSPIWYDASCRKRKKFICEK